jgi:hypothetical protein
MLRYLVATVIRELQIDAEIALFDHRNHFLQSIAIFAADADHIRLNGGLRFLF